jgi:1-acyl-sn-glycerol-3-phosphate acyltransferase
MKGIKLFFGHYGVWFYVLMTIPILLMFPFSTSILSEKGYPFFKWPVYGLTFLNGFYYKVKESKFAVTKAI